MATIGSHYVVACSTAAFNKNIDTDSLMVKAGFSLTNPQLSSGRISDNSMVQLLKSLVDATDDAFLGFASTKVPPKFFELILQSLFYCHTIEQAIATLQTGLRLAGCQLEVSHQDDDVILRLSHIHHDPQKFLLEYLLVFLHRVLSWLANQAIPLKRAEVNYQPQGYQQEFTLLFRCPVTFNQPNNVLIFDRRLLSVNMTRQHNEFSQVITDFPLIVLRFPGEEKQLNRRVYRLLVQAYLESGALLTASDVAKQLAISTATLRRKLAIQLTSFGQIKAEFRKEQAIKQLRYGNHTIEEIASVLGYSEARAFSRVFKLWTGLTPSQYREL